MKYVAILERTYLEDRVLGELNFYENHSRAWAEKSLLKLKTIELPWEYNERNISCIPEGSYTVIPRWSGKYGQHYHILNVPGRSFILFHIANFIRELRGCIAVGLVHKDIDNDGQIDVKSSGTALNKIHNLLKGEGFYLLIQDAETYGE